MTKTKYGPIEPRPKVKPKSLLVVPHRSKPLTVAQFGPNTYINNIQKMQGDFSCMPKYPQMSFTPATTSESISVASYEFEARAKPSIFDLSWLQLGWGVATSEGYFVNPPKDSQGKPITNEKALKGIKTKKINGIYLGSNDFGFAPFSTFEQGEQDSSKFVEGGLARILEHTEDKKAGKLSVISDPKLYDLGVDVFEFNRASANPVLIIPVLSSNKDGDCRLYVNGDGRSNLRVGYVFGKLVNKSQRS